MFFDNELKFEKALIDYLTSNCGWEKEIIRYPTEEDLIKNWAKILFDNNKEKDILNDVPLTDSEMAQIISQINSLKTPIAINNYINGTISITRDNPKDTLHFKKQVSLKVYDKLEIAGGKSRYQIVEQPLFKTNNSIYPQRRGDIMLLINGMPLFHLEIKRSNVDITQAENQIEKYMRNGVFSGIYSLIQIFIVMTPDECVYFANPGPNNKFNPDFYFHWEDFNNVIVNDWAKFCSQFLSIPMAHEMIGFYTIADDLDGMLKVMRSYQYFAASSIWTKVSKVDWSDSNHQHGGYIWHTTGSGKTMTSFKAAQLIANSKDADKVVFLLDRIELGDQTLIHYRNFASPDESIQSTEDTEVLISKLTSPSVADTLIVTSIQKMSRIKDEGKIGQNDLEKIKNKRIVFIIDECHRDQKGEMHQTIKKTFPNAIFFGFTGTPDHEYTADIFGDELHRYTIVHGIRDKNVLGFDPYMVNTFNESEMRLKVALHECKSNSPEEAIKNKTTKKKFLHYMGQGKTPCPMTEIESLLPKNQYDVITHKNAVVNDILKNWMIRSVASQFHALFATSSIKDAIEYYQIFKKINHNLKITAIFDPSDNNNDNSIYKMEGVTEIIKDYNEWFNKKYDINSYQKFKKDVCLRLSHKKPYLNLNKNETLNIVIVVDQLLTGFDSKWINTLYLDKVLSGKSLIQAMSRTNRLFDKDLKPHGTIIWYRYPYTMEENLKKAVESYSGNRPFGIFVNKLDKNIVSINSKFYEIADLFKSAGILNFEKNTNDTAWKKQFAKLFNDFNKYLSSAKIQGFDWKTKKYFFKNKNSLNVILDERIYLTLVQRYKELFVEKNMGKTEDVPYALDTYITQIKTESINDEYMNRNFVLYLKNLSCGDIVAAEKTLKELHKYFVVLTQSEQKIAKQILHDLESGNLKIDNNKTFRDYILMYQIKIANDEMSKFAVTFGIDENLLRQLVTLRVNEQNINAYGRYSELFKTLDKNKAKQFFENKLKTKISMPKAIVKADQIIRQYILVGGFNIDDIKIED